MSQARVGRRRLFKGGKPGGSAEPGDSLALSLTLSLSLSLSGSLSLSLSLSLSRSLSLSEHILTFTNLTGAAGRDTFND